MLRTTIQTRMMLNMEMLVMTMTIHDNTCQNIYENIETKHGKKKKKANATAVCRTHRLLSSSFLGIPL